MEKLNPKLLLLIFSDILIIGSFGLIGPIFAVFITDGLEGGSLVTAGLATTIFLVVKSCVQMPLSRFFIDKEKHKTHSLLLGTLFIISVPFLYAAAKSISTIFLAQAVYGIGAAMAYPAWFSLFTTYMNKKHKGFEYTLYSTGVGIGSAIAAYLGAEVANVLGFKYLFFLVGGIAVLGFLLLIILDWIDGKGAKESMLYSLKYRTKR
jgi:MFS family permease